MADEEKIKARLKQEGLEFPVMRDANEETVRIVGLGSRYGTPMTLLLDAESIVRWHGFNASDETADSIDSRIDQLLETFLAPTIPELQAPLKGYAKGKYAAAYKAAKKLIAAKGTDEALKTQAEQVVTNIDGAVKRLIEQSDTKRSRGYPASAADALESAVKSFKATAHHASAADKLKVLKADKAWKAEVKAEKALLKALGKLAKDPEMNGKGVRKALQRLAEACAESPVARRVHEALEQLD